MQALLQAKLAEMDARLTELQRLRQDVARRLADVCPLRLGMPLPADSQQPPVRHPQRQSAHAAEAAPPPLAGSRARTAVVCIVAPLAVLFPLTGASLVAALLIERAVWSLRQFAPSRSNPLH